MGARVTTKRTPAVGDTIEVLDGGQWVACGVSAVAGTLVCVRLHGFAKWVVPPTLWRWPGEAVDGTRRGRPRLPVAEKRRAVSLWLSPDERRELEAYAAREESMLGEAIRDAALRAARWKP